MCVSLWGAHEGESWATQKCCCHEGGVEEPGPVVLSSRVTAQLEKLEGAKALLLMIIQSSSHSHHLKSELIPQLPCKGPGAKAMSLCVCVFRTVNIYDASYWEN